MPPSLCWHPNQVGTKLSSGETHCSVMTWFRLALLGSRSTKSCHFGSLFQLPMLLYCCYTQVLLYVHRLRDSTRCVYKNIATHPLEEFCICTSIDYPLFIAPLLSAVVVGRMHLLCEGALPLTSSHFLIWCWNMQQQKKKKTPACRKSCCIHETVMNPG